MAYWNNNKATALERDKRLDLFLQEAENSRKEKVDAKLQVTRQKLPIFDKRAQILDLIRKNQVVLIKGESGCGKTTQVPQFILEDSIERGEGSVTNILVTQPRRISAVSVANRVSNERGENMGQNSGRQVMN